MNGFFGKHSISNGFDTLFYIRRWYINVKKSVIPLKVLNPFLKKEKKKPFVQLGDKIQPAIFFIRMLLEIPSSLNERKREDKKRNHYEVKPIGMEYSVTLAAEHNVIFV